MENTLTKTLEEIFEKRLKTPAKGLSLKKLQGDASYRIYYRALLTDGRSYIVMKMPAGRASASEEITNLKEKPVEPTFIDVGRFLKSRDLPVPEILDYDSDAGLIILEDLGDETLEKRVARSPETEIIRWYRKAIDLLIEFQRRGMEPAGGCIAHRRSFDATLLNWEFDHFVEYGIEARNGTKVPEADREAIRHETSAITEALIRAPQTLTHRDFQSRNLMIMGENLHLLDFQDALLGPLPYDLVALLRDSYVSLPWRRVVELITYYLQARGPKAAPKIDTAPFLKIFDQMTIQRKLKDAGRFVYIDRVKGNPGFLESIPNSLAYAREAFERQRGLHPLFNRLKKYVPEFR